MPPYFTEGDSNRYQKPPANIKKSARKAKSKARKATTKRRKRK